MKKTIILLLISLMTFMGANASHFAGAELWYEHVTGNTYEIKLRLYRDCGGLTMPTTTNIQYSNGLLVNSNLVLTQTASFPYTTCYSNACSNPASTTPGYEIGEYSGQVTLPSVSSSWKFSFSSCCRNPGIVNTNGAPSSIYAEASLDNSTTPLNNAAYNPVAINLVYSSGVQTTVNISPIETDGDSLDIHFTMPLSNATTPLVFNPGYSLNNPFGSTIPPVLDPQTGTMTFELPLVGSYVFSVQTDEYRNGNLIGSTIKDFQFTRLSGSANNLPTLSGVNNTANYFTTINVCANTNLTFTLNSADADVADNTTISANYIPTAATFTTNTAQNQVGTFTWPLTTADAQSQPYVLSFKVEDNNCGEQSYGYLVYVNQCNSDSVWAGDADADFTCNNYDVLSIGLANGSTGAVRPGATTTWQAEWCPQWTNSFISSINYKHADCNGDGTVNSADLAVVTANYGQIHMKQANVGQYKTAGLPDLYCDATTIQAERGTTISIPIMFGTTGSIADDFYGMSATVELLNAQTSAPISVTNNNSWIGNATNSFAFEKNLAPNKSAFTFVRNDQQNIMGGQGQIGTIEFPIDANSVLGSTVTIEFSDIKMIDNTGEEITDYNVLTETLTIVAPTNITDIVANNTIEIYPNPTKDYLNIPLLDYANGEVELSIYYLDGRKVSHANYSATTNEDAIQVDVNNLVAGQYILKLRTSNNIEHKSLFIKN